MSRRSVIAGGAVLGAALPAAAEAGEPQLKRHGLAHAVAFMGREWLVDPRWFGSEARVVSARTAQGISLSLTRARLPGSSLQTDLEARIRRRAGQWVIDVAAPHLGFRATADLGPWLGGGAALKGASTVAGFRLGRDEVSTPKATLEISPAFGFAFTAATVGLSGAVACAAGSILLAPEACASPGRRKLYRGLARRQATRFWMSGARLREGRLELERRPDTGAWWFESPGQLSIDGEAFEAPSGQAGALVLLSGSGAMTHAARLRSPAREALRLESAALLVRTDEAQPRVTVAGRVLRRPHAVRFADAAALVSGDDDSPFHAAFGPRETPGVTAEVRLEKLALAMPGGRRAEVLGEGQPIKLFAAQSEGAALRATSASGRNRMVWMGKGDPPFVAELTGPLTLRLTRSADLAALTFAFTGFDLKLRSPYNDTWQAVLRRRSVQGGLAPAQVLVTLPPQHMMETFFDAQEPSTCGTNPGPTGRVSEAALSGSSRVAFQLNGQQWREIGLDLDELTEWRDLALAVNRRADLESNAGAEAQARKIGLNDTDRIAAALAKIRGSLTPPEDDETCLELTTHLYMSPSSKARLRASPPPRRGAWNPLWHAVLDDGQSTTLRAIWSRLLQEKTFGEIIAGPLPKSPLLVVSATSQWELIQQNSVYGLPALRRIEDPNAPEAERAAQAKLPGGVAPLDFDYLKKEAYYEGQSLVPTSDVGAALATPFGRANVVLTPWGASFDAEWNGQPPHMIRTRSIPEGAWPASPNLERLAYRSQIGRDIRVEIVEKGYLLPLGLRASHVYLTERRFIRVAANSTMAYPVRRQFIVPHREQRYPLVHQPFGGLDFPAESSVRMETLRTPDLVALAPDPTEPVTALTVTPSGRVLFPGMKAKDKVFWPRVAPRQQPGEQKPEPGSKALRPEVEFKWTVDNDPAPVSSHMLFVGASALDSEKLRPQIAAYYNSLGDTTEGGAPTPDRPAPEGAAPSPLRVARLDGLKRRYAQPARPGDTSFDTESWVMQVLGRFAEGPGNTELEFFDIDARMNGADQPPYYPRMHRGRLAMQSLDRLLGRPQGMIEVGYNEEYRRRGFAGNASEIYLDVFTKEVKLDVSGQGQTSGGLAKPNNYLAAISRKNGLVGAQYKTAAQPPSDSKALALAHARARGQGPYDLSAAMNNRFEPATVFKNLNARLLGIIDLMDVVAPGLMSDAPKLAERVGYGVESSAGGAVKAIQDVIVALRDKPLTALNSALKKMADPIGDYPISAAKLYEDLNRKITAVRDDLQKRTSEPYSPSDIILRAGPGDLAKIAEPVGVIVADAQALEGEIERRLRDPVPPLLHEEVDRLIADWETFKTLAEGAYQRLGVELYDGVVGTELKALAAELQQAGLLESLLGLPQGLTFADVVEDPTLLLALPDTLFGVAFARPLAELLGKLRALRAAATGRLALRIERLKQDLVTFFGQAVATLESRLIEPRDAAEDNIINRAVQEKVADEVVAAARRIVDKLAVSGAPSPAVVIDSIRNVQEDLKAVSGELHAALLRHQATFKVEAGESVSAVLAAFEQLTSDKAVKAAQAAVADSFKEVNELLEVLNGASSEKVLAILLNLLAQVLAGLLEQVRFAALSEAGRRAGLWCHELPTGVRVAPMLDFADAAAGGLVGDLAAARQAITDITAAGLALQFPPSAPTSAKAMFDDALRLVGRSASVLGATIIEIDQGRRALAKLKSDLNSDPAVCDDIADVLRLVDHLLRARVRVADATADLAAGARRIASAYTAAGATAPQEVELIVRRGAAIVLQATSVEGIAGQAWAAVQAELDRAASAMAAQVQYVQRLRALTATLRSEAAQLRVRALATVQPEQLAALAGDVKTFVRETEKELLAQALESVALDDKTSAALQRRALAILGQAASRLDALYRDAATFVDFMWTVTGYDLVKFLLPSAQGRFKTARDNFGLDRKDFADIAAAGDFTAGRTAANRLIARWGTPPSPGLAQVVAVAAEIVGDVLKGHFARDLDIKPIVEQFRTQLQTEIQKLIPTRVDLAYDWGTELKEISAGSRRVFWMAPGGQGKDLTLASRISVDFLSGERHARMEGRLGSFWISLLGSFEVADIRFAETSFLSVDGSAPHFDMKVAEVKLGKMLEFLQPLQKWMAPQGSGFYITFNIGGIEAGYIYDAGVIQVGSLQFINVTLGVSATLPFSQGAATFAFHLGDERRPFLIAQPPYGGGGYLTLESDLSAIRGFEFSFVFGGVTAIKFGPLNAQGRIVTGCSVRRADGRLSVKAIIEAVGEGSIACFGICVFIRVVAEHDDDTGTLNGHATYSFSFSIGLTKLHYSFTASYTVRGGRNEKPKQTTGGGGLAFLSAAAPTGTYFAQACAAGPGPRITNNAKRKASEWVAYRDTLAMDLLRD